MLHQLCLHIYKKSCDSVMIPSGKILDFGWKVPIFALKIHLKLGENMEKIMYCHTSYFTDNK